MLGTDHLIIYSQSNLIQKITITPTNSNFAYPQSVFVDSPNGNIWITDFDNNRVLRFDVSHLTNINEVENSSMPTQFSLKQNYPNPFNPGTKINWQSPVGSHQTVKVFDVLGNEIATLVNEYKPAGTYEVEFRPETSIKHPASGIYFYQLKTGDFIQTKKMLYLK
jgi:hypothetical protein